MKKRVLSICLTLIVLLTVAGVLYYTSYPVIGIGKFVSLKNDNFENEFYAETINIWSAGNDFLPDSPLQERKMSEVSSWNNKIILELAEYRKEGGTECNIKVSGEIKDGKTTLRYEGYIIKKDGGKIDCNREKTFDFVLCSEKRFFTENL